MWEPFVGLSPSQVKHVQEAYPIFKWHQAATDVPWQMIAGVWYRESFSVAPPVHRPGGPFQFDPIPPEAVLKNLLFKYTNLAAIEQEAALHHGVNDFKYGGLFAACHLQQKGGGKLTLNASDTLVKDALWGYNGRAYGSADQSPYVMNGFDAHHFPMRVIGSEPDGHGGRDKIDIEDHRPGAFTVYAQLKVLFP